LGYKIIAEFVPRPNKGYIDQLASNIINYVDCFDIPDLPMGLPSIDSISLSIYIKTVYSKCVFAHTRLYDINTLMLLSKGYTVKAFNIDVLVVTRGDKPRVGGIVQELTTEKAIEALRKHLPSLRIGAIISLRYSIEDILERLNIGADLFLVLRFHLSMLDKYIEVSRKAREKNIELYPYILVETDVNRGLMKGLGQPTIGINELEEVVSITRKYVDGYIVSCPMDGAGLVKALKILNNIRNQ